MIRYSQFSGAIVSELRVNLKRKDMVVSGQTASKINDRDTKEGFQIVAPAYIEELESGVPPGRPQSLADLRRWISLRGLSIAPSQLARSLFARGSRLYRGVDPRFSGRKSGAISDVINEKRKEKLARDVSRVVIDETTREIIANVKQAGQ